MLRQLARRCRGLHLCAASSSALRHLPLLSAETFCSGTAPHPAAAEVLSPEPVTDASSGKGGKRRSGKQLPSLDPELLPQVGRLLRAACLPDQPGHGKLHATCDWWMRQHARNAD